MPAMRFEPDERRRLSQPHFLITLKLRWLLPLPLLSANVKLKANRKFSFVQTLTVNHSRRQLQAFLQCIQTHKLARSTNRTGNHSCAPRTHVLGECFNFCNRRLVQVQKHYSFCLCDALLEPARRYPHLSRSLSLPSADAGLG